MSEQEFKEAKGELAFSQQLVDKIRQQQTEESPEEEPQEEDLNENKKTR